MHYLYKYVVSSSHHFPESLENIACLASDEVALNKILIKVHIMSLLFNVTKFCGVFLKFVSVYIELVSFLQNTDERVLNSIVRELPTDLPNT